MTDMHDRLLDPIELGSILRRFHHAPRKGYGQHYLISGEVIDRICAACEDARGMPIVEIGPGVGTLTAALAHIGMTIIAVEADRSMERILAYTCSGFPAVTIVFDDASMTNLAHLAGEASWWCVGNIPYNITNLLVQHALAQDPLPQAIVFLVQDDVARRLAAQEGEWGLSTLATRLAGSVECIGPPIPRDAFLPPPSVASRIIRINPHRRFTPEVSARILDVARVVFQHRRKTLAHALRYCVPRSAVTDILHASDIDGERRPQTLGLDEWLVLTGNVAEWKACNPEGDVHEPSRY